MKRFAADLTISAVISCVLLLLLGDMESNASLSTAITIAFALVIVGPILGIVLLIAGTYAATKAFEHRRGGLALGLPLVLTVAPLIAAVLVHNDARTVQELVVRPFRPATTSSQVVVMNDREGECDSLCLQLLASNRYEVVQSGIHYRLVTGDRCQSTDALTDSALDFAEAGYADLCASAEKTSPSQTALRIDSRSVSSRNADESLPSSFSGDVYELIQHDATGDHLLGRWITGAIRPRFPQLMLLPAMLLGVDLKYSISPGFSRIEFYNAALGTALSSNEFSGTGDPRVILDRLQRLSRSTAKNDRLAKLLEATKKKVFILDALEAAAAHKNTPNYDEINTALSALNELPPVETGFVIDVIRVLAKRDDPRLLSALLASLLPLQDRSFAEEIVIELVTQPMSEEEETILTQSLMRAVVFVWKMPEDRLESIKQTYSNDSGLRPIQRWVILRMIASNQGRAKAVETVLSLRSPLFEQSVQAAQIHERFAIPLGYSDGWTYPECSTLLERTSSLPTTFLMAYLESLLHQCSDRWLKGRGPEEMYEKLHGRMTELENSTNGNSIDIQNIRAVLKRFAPKTDLD